MEINNNLEALHKLMRYWILTMTTEAGSGHPTSSLSAVELMGTLFFGGHFRFDVSDKEHSHNDRLIFSKGHAAPLFYALWAAADAVPADELMTLRKMGSRLEGHPTMRFPFTEVATGSLGQGLSHGVGMALAQKYLDKTNARTYVLLGDSEMAEGQVWEAMQLAAHYHLDNLVGIIDVNRLGQRGETMVGHDVDVYKRRVEAFGWEAIIVDGHNPEEIAAAYAHAQSVTERPIMIIARTIKGKGISFIENVDGWHGKPLSREELQRALVELGVVDTAVRGMIAEPETGEDVSRDKMRDESDGHVPAWQRGELVAPRDGYGAGLVATMALDKNVVVLDAEVSNSTRAASVQKNFSDRFFEMFIAEQNMASVAVGLALRGYTPYMSSFAAFLTRAHGQIRMAQFSDVSMVCVGTHPGISIGEDGSSQMGLEDIAFFRAILGSIVLYPADAVSTYIMTHNLRYQQGISYVRVTREKVPVLYDTHEEFSVGGSKTLVHHEDDVVAIVAAGITVHEALRAQERLAEQGIRARVIDAYSVKPLDMTMLTDIVRTIGKIIVVEDHYKEGGLGEAVTHALAGSAYTLRHLCITKPPQSGAPATLLAYAQIDAAAIVQVAQEMIQ